MRTAILLFAASLLLPGGDGALAMDPDPQFSSLSGGATAPTVATPATEYDFSYSYKDPYSPGADDYIVSVTNAVLHDEGSVTFWKPDQGADSLAGTRPGVIIYRFDFPEPIATADLYLGVSTFHWSYSRGHGYVYGSVDGVDWVELEEAEPPAFGQANTRVVRSLTPELLGGRSLWLKVELYSYGDNASAGGVWTNTAQHSRHDAAVGNTTFQLDVRYGSGAVDAGGGHCAAYDGGSHVLEVPCVEIVGNTYGAELRQHSQDLPVFELTGLTPEPDLLPSAQCASFGPAAPLLRLPCLTGAGASTSASLDLISSDPLLFRAREPLAVDPLYDTAAEHCAQYDAASQSVKLSCVVVGGDMYTVDLGLHRQQPMTFELTGIAGALGAAPPNHCAEYDPGLSLLHVPCIALGGHGMSAGLELESANPVRFGVREAVSLGPVSQSVLTDLYIHEDSPDPLVATFADVSGKVYALYGPKDANNFPRYYDALASFTVDAQGQLHPYLTLEFDAQGRPTAFRLPGHQGDVAIAYPSTDQAVVTVTVDGIRESVYVDNPFSGLENTVLARGTANAASSRPPYERTSRITYVGDIITCGDGEPEVSVQRNFGPALAKRYPILAQGLEVDVSANGAGDGADFSYIYHISIPGEDFASWSRWCQAGYFANASLGFIGVWWDRVGDLVSGVNSLFQDYKAGSTSNSTGAVVDKAIDTATGGIPVFSVARSFHDAWNVEGAGMNGPCSETAYRFKRRRLLHEQTITVDDGSLYILKKTYQPTARWLAGAGFVQQAPTFDFSAQCPAPEPEPEPETCDAVALARIIGADACHNAGGVWFPFPGSGSGVCECP